jgi:hypothetical protein
MAGPIFVRQYEPRDREAVRHIAVATALAGRPAALFMDGDDLLADGLTAYFTDYEPGSCFVAEMNGRVVGYIIGSVDTRAMDRVVGRMITDFLSGKRICSSFGGALSLL